MDILGFDILGQQSEAWVLRDGVFVPLLVTIGVVMIILIKTVGNVVRSNARERTRREVAAYIAEGSMTPEQGERLMKAGKEEA